MHNLLIGNYAENNSAIDPENLFRGLMGNFAKTYSEFCSRLFSVDPKHEEHAEKGLRLVHGLLKPDQKTMIPYAWIERGDKVTEIFERDYCEFMIATDRREFYEEKKPVYTQVYKPSEAVLLKETTGHSGPWSLDLQYKFILSRGEHDSELPH